MSSSRRRLRAPSPASASTRAAKTPASIPERFSVEHGRRTRDRHLFQRDGERLADGDLLQSGSDHARRYLYRVLSHRSRALFQHDQLFHVRRRQRTADGSRRRQRRFRLWSSSQFPTNTCQSTNFWVDVIFDDHVGGTGTTNQPPVAVNDTGPAVLRDTPVTITGASLLANDNDPNSDPLTIVSVSTAGADGSDSHGTAVLNTQTGVITYTPDAGIPARQVQLYGFGWARRDRNAQREPHRLAAGHRPYSLFTASDTPAQ